MIGHLTTATMLAAGGSYRAREARELRADAELALELGADARPVRYGAALELVDIARPPDDFESIVAGNIWHRAFAVGPLLHEPAPATVAAEIRIDGELADSAARGVDAIETARIAAELLSAVGERLEAGDVIIAGSLVQVPVAAGSEVVADLGVLGQVGVKLR